MLNLPQIRSMTVTKDAASYDLVKNEYGSTIVLKVPANPSEFSTISFWLDSVWISNGKVNSY